MTGRCDWSSFVAPSITSLENLQPGFLEGARSNEHIHLYDIERRGYLLVDVGRRELRADFRWVSTTLEPVADIETGSSWRVADGVPGATPG